MDTLTNLSDVIEVVLAAHPAESGLEALRFVGDVAHVLPLTVEEFALEQLETDNTLPYEQTRQRKWV